MNFAAGRRLGGFALFGCGGVDSSFFTVRMKSGLPWGSLLVFRRTTKPLFPIPELNDHARAIGFLCIHWASLELELDGWISALIPLEPGPAGDCVRNAWDMRDKIGVAKNLAFVRAHDPKWFDSVKTNLDHLDNTLRVERNRMVHDLWLIEGFPDSVGRYARKAVLTRPKAGQFQLSTSELTRVSADDIVKVTNRIIRMSGTLLKLRSEYMTATAKPSPDR